MNNLSKPTTSLANTDKVSFGETWATINTTWAAEIRTWAECESLFTNVSRPALSVDTLTLIDSLGRQHDTSDDFDVGFLQYMGQTFSVTSDATLDSCAFRIGAYGSPSGNIYAQLYAITGDYGTTSKPTGSVLATSDPVNVLTTPDDNTYKKFIFTGSNRVTLNKDTKYAIVCYYAGAPTLGIGYTYTLTGAVHSGNLFRSVNGSTWTAEARSDLEFEVYGIVSKTNAITNITKP